MPMTREDEGSTPKPAESIPAAGGLAGFLTVELRASQPPVRRSSMAAAGGGEVPLPSIPPPPAAPAFAIATPSPEEPAADVQRQVPDDTLLPPAAGVEATTDAGLEGDGSSPPEPAADAASDPAGDPGSSGSPPEPEQAFSDVAPGETPFPEAQEEPDPADPFADSSEASSGAVALPDA